MATALTARPFVSLALPDNRAARLLVQLALVFAGTLLLTLSAKTKVVMGPVDMSLQTLAIFLIAATFGMRLGVATLLLYMAEGALGFPVFQSTPEKGIGLVYMMGTTGGYLAGFVVAAAVVGWAADRGWDRNIAKFLAALLVAELAIMGLGYAWLATIIGAEKAWIFGVAPFIIPDLVKVGIAAALMPALWSLWRRGV
jgi:biotin transport system substrate-specific component